MKKNKKNIDTKIVRAINKNIRSSTRKLSPILKSIVGKRAEEAIRDLSFSEKEFLKILRKQYPLLLLMQKIIFNMILINLLLKKHIAVNK